MSKRNSISKHVNQQRIIDLLRSEKPLSRAEIARRTGLSKATVSRLTLDLEQQGFIKPLGDTTMSQNRKSVLFDFNKDVRCVVGIELHNLTLHGIVTNLEAKPLKEYYHNLPNTSVDAFIGGFGVMLDKLQKDIPSTMAGVSIGIQGICDNNIGIVIEAENLGWLNVPLTDLLWERYKVKVSIVNRANAAALGEFWYGAGKTANSLVYVHIGSGVGSGLVYEGKLILGTNNAAGEIGHITVLPNGPRCRCGNRGCLETVASANAITERIKILARGIYDKELEEITRKSIEQFSPIEVAVAAQAGNALVLDILEETAEYFGIAIGAVVNVINPQCIVLGGLAYYLPSSFISQIQKHTRKHSIPYVIDAASIVKSELGQNAVAIGAAASLAHELLLQF
jgi:glucokinase-like ROK family protein